VIGDAGPQSEQGEDRRHGTAGARVRYECGGVKRVDGEYAELKRMFVREPFRGRGLSRLLLDHLTGFARDHGFALLRLETGIYQKAAIGLYETAGFARIPPFGNYFDDPVSLCYEKRLR
jgi:GNAT superfamily N-acetyltransferase